MSAFAYGADALIAHGYTPLPIGPMSKAPGVFRGLTGDWSNHASPKYGVSLARKYFERDYVEPGTPYGRGLEGWSLITRERLTAYDLTAEGWDTERFGLYSLGHDFDLWKRMPHNGLGVKCGDGLVGIDIDSDDPDVIDAVMAIIGDHDGVEVIKRGRRGFTMFFFGQGISSTRIDFEGRADGIDILSAGKQSVLPPSIHPTTLQPYHWQSERTLFDTNLVELPTLTADTIEEIKARLESDGIAIKVGHPPRADVELTGGSNTYTAHVNDRALASLQSWVEDLGLYRGKWINGAYRAVPTWRAGGTGRPASQRKLNISISPSGIRDFGTEEGFTPISLVARARNCDWREAQSWLSARIGVEKMPPLPAWWLKAKEDRTAEDGYDPAAEKPAPRLEVGEPDAPAVEDLVEEPDAPVVEDLVEEDKPDVNYIPIDVSEETLAECIATVRSIAAEHKVWFIESRRLSREMSKATKAVNAATDRIAKLNEMIEDHDSGGSKAAEERAKLTERVDKLVEALADLERDAEERVSNLAAGKGKQATLDKVREKADRLRTRVAKTREQIEATYLNANRDKLAEELADLSGRLDSLKEDEKAKTVAYNEHFALKPARKILMIRITPGAGKTTAFAKLFFEELAQLATSEFRFAYMAPNIEKGHEFARDMLRPVEKGGASFAPLHIRHHVSYAGHALVEVGGKMQPVAAFPVEDESAKYVEAIMNAKTREIRKVPSNDIVAENEGVVSLRVVDGVAVVGNCLRAKEMDAAIAEGISPRSLCEGCPFALESLNPFQRGKPRKPVCAKSAADMMAGATGSLPYSSVIIGNHASFQFGVPRSMTDVGVLVSDEDPTRNSFPVDLLVELYIETIDRLPAKGPKGEDAPEAAALFWRMVQRVAEDHIPAAVAEREVLEIALRESERSLEAMRERPSVFAFKIRETEDEIAHIKARLAHPTELGFHIGEVRGYIETNRGEVDAIIDWHKKQAALCRQFNPQADGSKSVEEWAKLYGPIAREHEARATIIEALADCAENSSKTKAEHCGHVRLAGTKVRVYRPAIAHPDWADAALTIVLSATPAPDIITGAFFGQEAETLASIDVALDKDVRITRHYGAPTTATAMRQRSMSHEEIAEVRKAGKDVRRSRNNVADVKMVLEMLRDQAHAAGGKFAVISTKAGAAALPTDTDGHGNFTSTLGSDKMNGYSVLAVVGSQNPGPDVIRHAAMMLTNVWISPEQMEKASVEEDVREQGGDFRRRVFKDPVLEAFRWQFEDAPVIQALHRSRLLRPGRRRDVHLFNRVAVDTVVHHHAHWTETCYRAMAYKMLNSHGIAGSASMMAEVYDDVLLSRDAADLFLKWWGKSGCPGAALNPLETSETAPYTSGFKAASGQPKTGVASSQGAASVRVWHATDLSACLEAFGLKMTNKDAAKMAFDKMAGEGCIVASERKIIERFGLTKAAAGMVAKMPVPEGWQELEWANKGARATKVLAAGWREAQAARDAYWTEKPAVVEPVVEEPVRVVDVGMQDDSMVVVEIDSILKGSLSGTTDEGAILKAVSEHLGPVVSVSAPRMGRAATGYMFFPSVTKHSGLP